MSTRNTVAEQVKVGFANALEQSLQTLGLPYFKGGSRRFGYDSPSSDTDFFVLGEEKSSDEESILIDDASIAVGDLVGGLESLGFVKRPHDPDYSQVEGLHYLYALDSLLHVAILTNKDRFAKLRKAHQQVDALLAEHPFFGEVARQLKEMGMKGSFIFTLLCRLAHAG